MILTERAIYVGQCRRIWHSMYKNAALVPEDWRPLRRPPACTMSHFFFSSQTHQGGSVSQEIDFHVVHNLCKYIIFSPGRSLSLYLIQFV